MMKILLILTLLILSHGAEAARLKDISNIRGVRENQLVGYGLVVGLNGTGDGKAEFTSKSFVRMLDTIGMKLDTKDIESKNVAAVIITATLPAESRAGNKIDVTVNSIGSASSLQGGTLIQTPLRAADQQVYAVAQGTVLTGASTGGQGGGEKGHLTVGRVPGGAMVETDLASDFANRKMFRLTLNHADFTTAARIVKTINQDLGGKFATAKDSGTIDVIVPFTYEGNAVELMASIENLDISQDARARVVVNEKTGTVVIGEKVQIQTVAVSHGNLSVQVKTQNPEGGEEVRAPSSTGGKKDKGEKVALFNKTTSVGDLVKALNALGVTPKDLITILQTIKAAGALQGELEVL
ncbi:MAG: flagellar basal body P-ring protein FlgI [Oligoflexia bacterium]|nr:flagellar basal body P-ring protein FlgI [Oligoflexia bacterium]